MKNKLKRNLMIDHETSTIIMGGDFARRAANTESEEYKHLMSVKSIYSDYKIKRRTIKKKTNKESYKGLTYEFMERHILLYDPASIVEYKQMRYISECHSIRYPTIKKWFLEKYPDVKNYGVISEPSFELKMAS